MIDQALFQDNHEKCLDLLDKFTAICDQNKIKYYLVEGSALGAIRHKGFIPWDINVDIMLDVDNYIKLNKAMKSTDIDGYIWGKPEGEARLCSLFSRPDYLKLDTCPNIDVAIYGYAPNSKIGRWIAMNILFFNIKMFKLKNTDVKRSFPFNLLRYITRIFPDVFYFRVLKHYANKRNANAKYRIALTPTFYGEKEFIESQWIGNQPKIVEFEGRELPTINDYDAYLRHRYGDYMTPVVWEGKGEHKHNAK